MEKKYGVDISEHNVISDDAWAKLRSENDFVIIRCAWGTNLDKLFKQHYAKALSLGFKIGYYVYSYALDGVGAKAEADYCNTILRGLKNDLGVWYDMEDADGYKSRHMNITRERISNLCSVFCQNCKNLGGVYANKDWFDRLIDTKHPKWVAEWGTNGGALEFERDYYIHQFTSNYVVAGKRFDRNVSVFKVFSANANVPSKATHDVIALQIYKGDFGNGQERINNLKALGYNDAEIKEIQTIVNQKYYGKTGSPASFDLDGLALQVYRGDFGNGDERTKKLKSLGLNDSQVAQVQALVNAKYY